MDQRLRAGTRPRHGHRHRWRPRLQSRDRDHFPAGTPLTSEKTRAGSVEELGPPHRQRFLEASEDIDSRIRCSCLDTLEVTPVHVHELGEPFLRQTAQPTQAYHILAKGDPSVGSQAYKLDRKSDLGSGLIVAFWLASRPVARLALVLQREPPIPPHQRRYVVREQVMS